LGGAPTTFPPPPPPRPPPLSPKTKMDFFPPPPPPEMIELSDAYGGVYRFFGALALVCLTQQTSLCYAAISESEAIHLVLVA